MPTWRVMNETSRSRRIGINGFCTAPIRAKARRSTTASSDVGNCQDTTVPARTPRAESAAAVASAAWRSCLRVSDLP